MSDLFHLICGIKRHPFSYKWLTFFMASVTPLCVNVTLSSFILGFIDCSQDLVEGSFFSTVTQHHSYLLSGWWPSFWSKVESQFSLKLHFSNDHQCWAFLLVSLGHVYFYFCEVSIYFACSFFDWVCYIFGGGSNFLSSLSILDINFLSEEWLVIFFSHCVGCLFTLLVVSFAMQKLSNH